MILRLSRLPAVQLKAGVCFGCGCTDEESCFEGCEWIDSDHTMCSACDGRARHFLAWYRFMEKRRARAGARS
jgi:hypothetical protein